MKIRPLKLLRTLADWEQEIIMRTLLTCLMDRERTAQALGICERTLRKKLMQYKREGATILPANHPIVKRWREQKERHELEKRLDNRNDSNTGNAPVVHDGAGSGRCLSTAA